MNFLLIARSSLVPREGLNQAYLRIDHWNDFSFVTMFDLSLHDDQGEYHDIGRTKIGFMGQTTVTDTFQTLNQSFERLGENYFSLGQSGEYYSRLMQLSGGLGYQILDSLRDIVKLPSIMESIEQEPVFRESLLRHASISTVKGQFARLIRGQAEKTNFALTLNRDGSRELGAISLKFEVKVGSLPSTNVHALIGRNGVGKTTLLAGVVESVLSPNDSDVQLLFGDGVSERPISNEDVSAVIFISFSAFDPFSPFSSQADPTKGVRYHYIGLKDSANAGSHLSIDDLSNSCITALMSCFMDNRKAKMWLDAVENLGSDENFANIKLSRLNEEFDKARALAPTDMASLHASYASKVTGLIRSMSAGHAIVLLVVSWLVSTLEEKALVIFDEPESHLHPPLLSALVRTISELLRQRNAVAILATHSPVVLQEIPRKCVWKIFRNGSSISCDRPVIETFGENVGILTSEVFGLEVERSGFLKLLNEAVNRNASYEYILREFSEELGSEGRAILATMIYRRDMDQRRS